MASYGWTLKEALELTYPQLRRLYQMLQKYPTANLLVAGLAQGKDPELALGKLGDVVGKMDPAVAGQIRRELGEG